MGPVSNSQGTGVSSLTVSPQTVGDALVLLAKISSSTTTVSSVSGGGPGTWSKVGAYEDASGHDLEVWLGTVTKAGSGKVSLTYSASVGSISVELVAQEFTAGLGSASVWTKDVAAGQSNATSSTVASPTLSAATSGELYVSYSRCPGQVDSGSTPGVTYHPTALGNMFLFDPNVTGAISPTSSQSPADTSSAIGALIAVAGSGPPPAPTVSAVAPSSGPSSGGTSVTVRGTNFAVGNTVTFGATAATGVTVASSTSLTATAPAGSGTINVTVSGPGGTSATSAADQFTYVNPPPTTPTVSSISPSGGPTGGITHQSSTFPRSGESYGNNSLLISPVQVGDLVVLSMQLHATNVTINSISGGNVSGWQRAVSYTNTGTDVLHYEVWWGVATAVGPSTLAITYSAPVSADAIELIADSFTDPAGLPWSVVAGAGASGAVSSSAVWPAIASGPSADQLYWGASEEETTGTGGSTPGFTYGVTANLNCFLYDTSLSPNTVYAPSCTEFPNAVSTEVGVIFAASGSAATSVTVKGTNFALGDSVDFGTTSSPSVTVVSPSTITAFAPRSPTAGTVDVTVSGPSGTSATSPADQFTYSAHPLPAPTVTAVSPASGPSAGGTQVTVNGSNFASGDTVAFGTTAATGVTVTSATSLSATAPAGTGTVDVTVSGPSGTSATSPADQFTYSAHPPPAPTVTAVSPASGPSAGGTQVTVNGSNFASGDTVAFGTTAATGVTVTSATSLSATAPAGTGTVDVTVSGPSGTSATSAADRFTYVSSPPPPSISAVGPVSNSQGTGVSSLTVSPQTVGDALVLLAKISSSTTTVSSVSGGGPGTWSKVGAYEDASGHDLEVWLGTVTKAGSGKVSLTYSASVGSISVELVAQEFTAGLGSASVWTKDVAAGQSNATSSTVASPTLSAATSGELYVSYSRCPGQVDSGSTPGVTYHPTALGNMFLFDPNVTGAISPTSSQSPADTSSAIGALIAVAG